MSDAIFLCDTAQIPAALRLQRRLGPGARLITGDMTTAWELERRGVAFVDEHDCITGDELLRNWEIADGVAGRWWGGADTAIAGDGAPLLDAARGDLRLPIELCLDAATVYRRLLADRRIRRAHIFFVPPTAICRTQPAPGTRAAASLSQGVLRGEAERAGIEVVPACSRRPLDVEGRRGAAAEGGPPAATAPVVAASAERTMLLLDGSLRAAETAALEQAIAGRPGWRVLRLTPWELAAGGSLDRPWLGAATVRGLARLEEAVAGSQSRGDPADMLASPYLRFQLARIVAELQSAARIGAAFGELLAVVRPALCVLGHDAFTVERVLVRVARRHGVPTAALIHGGFRPRRIYRDVTGEADRLLVWGAEDTDGLIAAGVAPERVRTVGSIIYEQRHRPAGAAQETGIVARARAALGVPADRPLVLVLTATTTKGLAAIARPAVHRACWRQLAALAARRPDLTFAIKPHPSYDHFELYRRLVRDGPESLVFLEDVPLPAALAAAAVTVLINYTTTAAMESVLVGVPVVLWQAGLHPGNGDDPLSAGGALIVTNIAALEAAADRLLADTGARTAALAAAARATERILGGPGVPAIDRVVAELIATARPAGGDPGRHGAEPAPSLAAVAYMIGVAAGTPAALRRELAEAFAPVRAAGAVPTLAIARATAVAYLAAIASRTAAADQRGARAFARGLMLAAPRVVLAWPAIRRSVTRHLAGGLGWGTLALDLAARVRALAGRWRAGWWRPPRIVR